MSLMKPFEIPFKEDKSVNKESVLYKIAEQCLKYDPK